MANSATIYIVTPSGTMTSIGTVDTAYNSNDNYYGFADYSRTDGCIVYCSRNGKYLKYDRTNNTISQAYSTLPANGMLIGVYDKISDTEYIIRHNGKLIYKATITWGRWC